MAKQYFGDPINCQTSSGVESKVLDDYCWIHSTFHIRSEYQVNTRQSSYKSYVSNFNDIHHCNHWRVVTIVHCDEAVLRPVSSSNQR